MNCASASLFSRVLVPLISMREKLHTAQNILIGILIFLFLTLVGSGVTGSSLGIGLRDSGISADNGEYALGSKPRSIRSDEWLVLAPMAIAQLNHVPAFPVHNSNLGPDGQSMLIVGMTGMPVAHISALGKPATWGFFFLDLKRALAWYWWLPIFASLGAVWGLMQIGLKLKWNLAVGCAALTILSPYMTAWSYWPAYTALFPSLALISIIKIHTSERVAWQAVWSCLFVIGTTGFFLILYPAWQIPLAYLFLVLFAAIYVRDRLWQKGSLRKYVLLAISILSSAAIIYFWWIDARDAIHAITNTVYPGQRSEVVGGDIQGWIFAKGYLSPWTMFSGLPGTNQSEAASFFYFIVPLSVLFVLVFKNGDRDYLIAGAILIFVVASVTYQFFGFGPELAKYSLWGRTTAERVDLPLGFAQMLLLATLMASFTRYASPVIMQPRPQLALFVAVLCASFVLYWTSLIPHEWRLHRNFFFAQYVAIVLAGAGSYLLVLQKFSKFVILIVSPSILIALLFNPIYVPPERIQIAEITDQPKATPQHVHIGEGGRVLVIGSQIPAMILLAAGTPVMSSVQYYPQDSIWKILDPSGDHSDIYNRYQHLLFWVDTLPAEIDRTIATPQLDVVTVTVDGARFDFSALPIQQVLGSVQDTELLKDNASLSYVGMVGTLRLFRVLRAHPSPGVQGSTIRLN